GMLIGSIGIDVNTGMERYTFGILSFSDGIDFAVVAMGLFGIGEVIANLEHGDMEQSAMKGVRALWPSFKDMRSFLLPALRGVGLGSALGLLPGAGPVLASFSAYGLEKKIARDPSRFGKGAIEGVAAPEAANNAAAQTSFVPMLTLGLPASAVMALIMGA